MSFMSKKLKVKSALLAGVVVLSLIIMGVILSTMQDNISLENYRADIQREMDELPTLLETADDETAQNEETFDAIYQSKAASVAFMANNKADYEAINAKMQEYKELLGVDNVMIVNKDGKIEAQAQDTLADFSYARYNELRNAISSGEPSAAVEVEFAGENQTWRCYSARIDDNTMVVIEQNPVELTELIASRNLTVAVILFIFFSVAAIVALYGIFVMREDEKRGYNPENFVTVGPLRYNKAVGRKAIILSFVGFLLVAVVTFYMQTLFSLSAESVSSHERATDIEQTIASTNEQADLLTEQYNERYLNKAQTAAHILDTNPELATKEKLQELADVLQIQYLYVFDAQGNLDVTNSPYTNFVLSEDPADQGYAFRKLLQGVEYVIQDPMPDEVSGELRQYIGVTLHDASGNANGFVQLGIRSSRLETLLASVQLGRDLLREMKLVFDEHEIRIPYSQVVVHQPSEYKKATIREQLRADKFNDDQKVAARDLGNEAAKK